MNEQQKKDRLEKWQEAESPFYRRWRVYSTFFTGFAIGLFYVLLISGKVFNWLWRGSPNETEGQHAVVLIFSGILGGVIYTIMIDGHVEMPQFIKNRGDQFRAGLFGDILLGIAGAILLDYIATQLNVPLAPGVEVAAVGIVGGYGGRAILQFALQRVFKDINILEADRQAYLQANLQRKLERIDSLELIDQINQHIKVGLSSRELSILSTEIEQSDSAVRKRIFNIVQDMRLAAKAAGDHERIEHMKVLFEALIKGDPNQHTYHAELAFAYKDSGSTDYFQATQYLNQAIALRSESQRITTWNYELSRAITRIEAAHQRENSYDFDAPTEDLIIEDLLAVSHIYNFETLLKDIKDDNIPLPLLNWVRHNQADLLSRDDTASLALKITNFLEADSRDTDTPSTVAAPSLSPGPLAPKTEERETDVAPLSEARKIDRDIFFKEYRDIFRSGKLNQRQVDIFDAIFDYWDQSPYTDSRWLAYAIATAYHETGGRMEPVREGFAKDDSSAIRAVERLLANGRIKQNYAKLEANGKSYFGRGLVQITHGYNYRKLGQAIGLGSKLYDDPSLALDKDISVKLLFKGMTDGLYRPGHKLSVYFNTSKEDWYGAREMINADKHYKPQWTNGKSLGQLIADHGKDFHRCCKASANTLLLAPVRPKPVGSTGAPKKLAVRYFSQRNNASEADRTCNTTSCWMGALYMRPELWDQCGEDANSDFNYYLPIVNKYGKTTDHTVQTKALAELGIKSRWHTNLTLDDVKKEIDQERPVVLGVLHHGPASSPTGFGHIILAVGYDDTGMIIHDPNGDMDLVHGGYPSSADGAYRHYSYKNLQPRFEVGGSGNGWGRFYR